MSICNGLDGIIDRHLEVTNIGNSTPHYARTTSALQLSKKAPSQFNAESLLREMLACLEKNWQASPRRLSAGPSKENWRWAKQQHIASHNLSPEKTLEKKIANITSDDWVNQVPTASGLFSATNDKHRNIDLVHRLQAGEYEFIELKVNSDTPLKAAMEVIQYAILYTFARLHYPSVAQQGYELLQAKTIHLRVLAPANYYARYNLAWLVPSLDLGLQSFLATQPFAITMDFQFVQFPASFVWPCHDQECLAALQDIVPVTWE